MADFVAAAKWLAKKRRWNARELVWSIHKDNTWIGLAPGLLHAFSTCPMRPWRISFIFSLLTDTYSQAAGKLWSRVGAIPMGGPFSAQSADLQSVLGG